MRSLRILVAAAFLFAAFANIRAEFISEADELLLQKILSAMRQREDEATPVSAPYGMSSPNEERIAADEAAAEAEEEFAAEEAGERMFRDRKEGQISVYNYAPSIRDQEYLEHSSLWGHQYMAGGAGEGFQRLKPDGSGRNVQVVKSDAVLPAYCNPPNPCPIGYTADDGCLENFENTAAFCREYQQQQECMCDTEHMFDCPGSTKDDEVNTLAQQISNEGLVESALDRIAHKIDSVDHTDNNAIPVEGEHKSLVAKKFFNRETHEEYTRSLSEKNQRAEEQQRAQKSRSRRSALIQEKGGKKSSAKSFKSKSPKKVLLTKSDKKNRNSTAAYQKASKSKVVMVNPYLQGEKLPVVAKKG